MLYILHHIAVLCRLALQCLVLFVTVCSCSIPLHYTLTPIPTTTHAHKYLRLGVNFIKACAVRSVPEADLPIRCVFA